MGLMKSYKKNRNIELKEKLLSNIYIYIWMNVELFGMNVYLILFITALKKYFRQSRIDWWCWWSWKNLGWFRCRNARDVFTNGSSNTKSHTKKPRGFFVLGRVVDERGVMKKADAWQLLCLALLLWRQQVGDSLTRSPPAIINSTPLQKSNSPAACCCSDAQPIHDDDGWMDGRKGPPLNLISFIP